MNKALRESDSQGNSTVFIKFMLGIILKALKVFDKKTSGKALCNTNNDNVNNNVKLSENQKAILKMLAGIGFCDAG